MRQHRGLNYSAGCHDLSDAETRNWRVWALAATERSPPNSPMAMAMWKHIKLDKGKA